MIPDIKVCYDVAELVSVVAWKKIVSNGNCGYRPSDSGFCAIFAFCQPVATVLW